MEMKEVPPFRWGELGKGKRTRPRHSQLETLVVTHATHHMWHVVYDKKFSVVHVLLVPIAACGLVASLRLCNVARWPWITPNSINYPQRTPNKRIQSCGWLGRTFRGTAGRRFFAHWLYLHQLIIPNHVQETGLPPHICDGVLQKTKLPRFPTSGTQSVTAILSTSTDGYHICDPVDQLLAPERSSCSDNYESSQLPQTFSSKTLPTSNHGLKKAHILELSGPPGSPKERMALSLMKNAIQMGERVVLLGDLSSLIWRYHLMNPYNWLSQDVQNMITPLTLLQALGGMWLLCLVRSWFVRKGRFVEFLEVPPMRIINSINDLHAQSRWHSIKREGSMITFALL